MMTRRRVCEEFEDVLVGKTALVSGERSESVIRLKCKLGVPSYKSSSGEWRGIDWDEYKRLTYDAIVNELWKLDSYNLGETLPAPLVIWIKNKSTLDAPNCDLNNFNFKHIVDAIAIAFGRDDNPTQFEIYLSPQEEFGSEIIIAPQKEFLIELQSEIDKKERQYFE